ncbi:MAG: BatD family protein [Chitinophagaceae bacterium]
MQRIVFIFLLAVYSFSIKAQVVFRTDVTQGPVIAGESFQVQYVLENFNDIGEFSPPDFKNFRIAGGPFVYEGATYSTDGIRKVKNVVYTLEPLKPGKFIIHGANAKVDGHLVKSDNAAIEVISKAEAFKRGLLYEGPQINPTSYLKPGEDPYEKIRKNLFLKVLVDKKSCYVGEPITATFKLYSRVESRSDIVKNPAFYGFTVQDMIGLNDAMLTNETINGKTFDVHTVRKVQLYPLQSGSYTIDAMEVENKVQFSKSMVGNKTEQEIIEGIFDGDNSFSLGNDAEVYESSMHSEPISIVVKPSPEKNKPADFSGATGKFSIDASVRKNKITKNEEGELIVTISGNGNFTQLTAPTIQWPQGIETFDPQVKDALDNRFSPLKGSRTFHFPFVPAKAGDLILPAVSFSFFDPGSDSYKTVTTNAIKVDVAESEKIKTDQPALKKKATKISIIFILGGIFILLAAAGGGFLWYWKRKQSKNKMAAAEEKNKPRPITEILQPALESIEEGHKVFYTNLRSGIWNFFSLRLGFSGSMMNRDYLLSVLKQKNINQSDQRSLLNILEQCEAGIYTDAHSEIDKSELLRKTSSVLEQIDRSLI